MRWPRPTRAEAPLARGPVSLSAGPAFALCGAGGLLALLGLAIVGAPLAVPGLALAVLGALCMLVVEVNLHSARVGGRALAATVIEDQPLRLALTVRPPLWLGLGTAWLEHPLLSEPLEIERGAPRSVVISARADRRGRVHVAAPAIRVVDPLGLVRGRQRARGDLGDLLVLPRVEPVHWLTRSGLREDSSAAWTAAAATEATDLAGLREYQPGTPATRIHWPALARGGGLLERVFESDVELTPLVLLDVRGTAGARGAAALDALIRAVVSVTLELARSGGVELLLPGASAALALSPSLGEWPGLHRALALLELAPPGSAPPRCPADRAGRLVYACLDPELSVPARARWAGETLTLSPPGGAPPAGQAVLEVAGCVAVAGAGNR